MNIENSLVKMYSDHHFHHRDLALDGNGQMQAIAAKRIRHHDEHDDRLQLSDAGKAAQTEKMSVDPDKMPSAEHQLSIQIINLMVKRITGQDLQLAAPAATVQNQTGDMAIQTPQQPPAAASKTATEQPSYQQSQSYFEAQILTFNAEGSIATQDGQSVKFSVSLSMSHLFYSQTNLNVTDSPAKDAGPLQVSFDGTAAELSTTSFHFSIDSNGSSDQVSSEQPATAPVPAGLTAPTQTDTAATTQNQVAVANPQKPVAELADTMDTVMDAVKNIFKALRIWQHHDDGSHQLMALGEENLGAIFLGHVTKPLQAVRKDDGLTNVVTNSSIVAPEQVKQNLTPSINISA